MGWFDFQTSKNNFSRICVDPKYKFSTNLVKIGSVIWILELATDVYTDTLIYILKTIFWFGVPKMDTYYETLLQISYDRYTLYESI